MALLDLVRGCTFDDFLLTPQSGQVLSRNPRVMDLSTFFTAGIPLRRPLVSANMDTVTRAPMAIVMAEEGGIGVIDRGYRPGDIQPQITEVSAVKRTQHGTVTDPRSIAPTASVTEARSLMREARIGTLVVVDADGRLTGLLTERDVRFVDGAAAVSERMTPRERLVVREGKLSLPEAEQVMVEHKVKKLPLVGPNGRVEGLITTRDLIKFREHPFATRDGLGRLRVAAAIGATGDFLERAAELLRVGADALVIDIAHGHSLVMERALEAVRARFGTVPIVAGNVATAEGVRFLVACGADAVKVGIGPGGGCTTRLATNFGVPQVEALVRCRLEAGDRVPLIADGGVRRDGALVQALLFGGSTVMLGSAFAGTLETPGETVMKPVLVAESQKVVQVPFKVFRGMASVGAVRDRLDLEEAGPEEIDALGAEGLEVSVPARGSARGVIQDMLKHLCSAVSYGGATSLDGLRQAFTADPERFLIRLSSAAQAESFLR